MIKNETSAILDLTSSFQSQTDDVIRDMDSVSINMDYSQPVKALLGSGDLDLSAVSLPDFANLCVTINGVENKVNQINLYDYEGNILQVGIWTRHQTVDLNEIPWLEDTKKYGGSKILSTPYITSALSRYASGSDWCISLYRAYYDNYGRNTGALETVKQCKSIFKNILSYGASTDTPPACYVYNKDGVLLYPYVESDSFDYYGELDPDVTHMAFQNPQTEETEILAYKTSAYTGWTYVTVQPQDVILRPVNKLLQFLYLVLILMLAISIIVAYFLSHQLIRPINLLNQEIAGTNLSTLDKPSETPFKTPYRELEELNQAFQTMRVDLKASMDDLIETRQQELKSRTLALQSQINPHFYYNSLASVIALAENDRNDEVVRMCHSLTRIMRYITNSSAPVTLRDEMDYIDRYLYCMKVRYQTSLNYIINVDPDLEQEPIPRLLIQPIVENAIKYGINSNPPWGIAIHGKIYEDHWQLDIMDSGNGFSEEALATIQKRIDDASRHPGMPEMQINGMGTLNVYLRWKLFCQDDMIFEFGNTPAGHGIVSLGRKIKKKEDVVNES
ncbi:MAG: histidine kinase [Lachnospiraceae bacterium]|nr:histidine kinase [Lachnospiraceae bacterium]